FRIRPSLELNLVAAAKASYRSVSEEIEYRLEESFRDKNSYVGYITESIYSLHTAMDGVISTPLVMLGNGFSREEVEETLNSTMDEFVATLIKDYGFDQKRKKRLMSIIEFLKGHIRRSIDGESKS